MKEGKGQATLLVILTLSLVMLPLQTIQAATTYGNIHGTIVDEDGNPIEDVKVSAYLNTGSLEDSVYTNVNGYFRMNLGGTYTLVFEKTGYVTYEKTVQVTQAPSENPENDIVKLGEITLEKTLSRG